MSDEVKDMQQYSKLGNLADIVMGQSPDSSSVNSDERGLPFLQGCAEFGKISPEAKAYCMPPLRVSKAESILVSVRAPVGTMNWGDQSYCIGRGLAAIKAKLGEADTKFLGYSLAHNVSFLHRRSQGSTFLAISANDLKIFPIPEFSPIKQKRISEILQTIDQVIEKTEALIEKYQQIKAGLMHDLFTRGVGADGQLRPPREQAPELYHETPIGWIPKEWKIKPIGDLFTIQLGKMLSRASKTGKCEYPYLGNKNVQWDRVYIEGLETMDFHPSEREKFKLIYGDLLVCEGGEVGRTAMWREELDNCFYQKAIHRLRPIGNDVLPGYMLRFMLYAKNMGMFENYTSQTSIAHLTQEKLSLVNMFLPDIVEQEKLVERFDVIDQKVDHELICLEKLKKQKSGLMHDLLTGKVPVKLDNAEENQQQEAARV